MKKVAIIGCGSYMETVHGCPGEWRCFKAAALGEGKFKEPSQVMVFLRCECPGRATAPNMGMAIKLSEIKPDEIYLSSCMVNAKPECPYHEIEDLESIIKDKTGVEVVVRGTHEYR